MLADPKPALDTSSPFLGVTPAPKRLQQGITGIEFNPLSL